MRSKCIFLHDYYYYCYQHDQVGTGNKKGDRQQWVVDREARIGQNGRAFLADGRYACLDADSAAAIRPVLAMCLWRIGSIKYSEYAKIQKQRKTIVGPQCQCK